MSGLRNAAISWYRKVFGAPAGSDIRDEGLDTVLDGNSAVALSEAGIASHAVLGGSFPAADTDSLSSAAEEPLPPADAVVTRPGVSREGT